MEKEKSGIFSGILLEILKVLLVAAVFAAVNSNIPAIAPPHGLNSWEVTRPYFMTPRVVEVTKTLYFLYSYYLLTRQFVFYRRIHPVRHWHELIKSRDMLLIAGGAFAFCIGIPSVLAFVFRNALFGVDSGNEWIARLIIFFPMTAVGFAGLVKGEKLSTGRNKGNAFFGIATLVIALPLLAYMLISFAVPGIYLVFGLLWRYLWIFLIIPAMLCVFSLVYGFSKRRKFFRKLDAFCAENSFEYTLRSGKYLSLIKDVEGFTFTLFADGNVYDCKLLPTKKIYTTTLCEDGKCLRVFSFGMRHAAIGKLFDIKTKHTYGFESENKKILLFSPSVSPVFCEGNGLLDNGSSVYGYKIYTGQAFMNAIMRKCV